MELVSVNVKNSAFKVPDRCDFCGKKNDNLFVKPTYMKVNGELMLSIQASPLWICLECFKTEFED